MSEPRPDHQPLIPEEVSKELRMLAHDLSNSIETIMQATYLLGQANVDEDNRKWVNLIDQATHEAAKINRQIREVLRAHSPQL
jgi:nitrogen-specific signal transduction histidine kinase